MTEHICQTCSRKRPACGHKREVKEGYCRDWSNSSKETNVVTKAFDEMDNKTFYRIQRDTQNKTEK